MSKTTYFLIGGILILAAVFLVVSLSQDNINLENNNQAETADWIEFKLTDVRTGEAYSIKEFDKPVLLESFAVWCPTCLKQQQEVDKLHEMVGESVISISLDTDPNEDGRRVREHIERHGFDWIFSVSPPAMTKSLIDEFGAKIVAAPQAPMVLICGDKTEFLESGVKTAEELREKVENCRIS